MDAPVLVEEDLDVGGQLVAALVRDGFQVTMAAWILDAEIQTWRLVLASTAVDLEGSLKVYQQIDDVLTREGLRPLDLDRIVAPGGWPSGRRRRS